MTTLQVHDDWVMFINRRIFELIPFVGADKHYAADECWCNPNTITLINYDENRRSVTVWVHDSKDTNAGQSLHSAISGLLTYWEGIYHL